MRTGVVNPLLNTHSKTYLYRTLFSLTFRTALPASLTAEELLLSYVFGQNELRTWENFYNTPDVHVLNKFEHVHRIFLASSRNARLVQRTRDR